MRLMNLIEREKVTIKFNARLSNTRATVKGLFIFVSYNIPVMAGNWQYCLNYIGIE
jgi:hypothetical protein